MAPTADTAAFVEQLTGCQSRLYAYVAALLGNPRDASDVLQETNAVLWKNAGEFDPSRPFLPWAYRFAHFQVLAFRKKLARDRLLFNDELLGTIAEEYVRQDQKADRQLAALEDCLAHLPPRQRHLIEQRYSKDAAVASLAEQAGIEPNALSALLYRVRQALANCIRNKLAGEAT